MARMGGSGLGIERHALSIVPSPPTVMIKSVFIFSNDNAVFVFFNRFASLGSRKVSTFFAFR